MTAPLDQKLASLLSAFDDGEDVDVVLDLLDALRKSVERGHYPDVSRALALHKRGAVAPDDADGVGLDDVDAYESDDMKELDFEGGGAGADE